MVTPTTASAAEATPELPGTLGVVRTVSATPQVVWRSWSDTGGGLEYLSSTVITLSVRRLPAPTSPGGCSIRYPHTERSAATSSTTWPSETCVPQGTLKRPGRSGHPRPLGCRGCWPGRRARRRRRGGRQVRAARTVRRCRVRSAAAPGSRPMASCAERTGGGVEGVDGGQRAFGRGGRCRPARRVCVGRARRGPARCIGPRSSRQVIRWCMDCGRSETMRARSAWLRSGSSARAARTPAAW